MKLLYSLTWRTLLLISCLHSSSESFSQKRVLIFSKTAGYRHSSIDPGKSAINQLGNSNGFSVEETEDANDFNLANLSGFNAVIFLNTTGDILNNSQQAAFESYIRSGGGYVGVHAATDAEYGWPWYGQLAGAWFNGHPEIQQATLQISNTTHPSTSSLPSPWQRTDEWYNFGNFQSTVNVLIRIDENSYSGGTMGNNHPIAWYHEFEGGRSWYTALGHTDASYNENAFLSHLLGGIQYAMGSGTPNQPPKASAGNNQGITLPVNNVTLKGSGEDPDGTIVSLAWTKVSGPGSGGGTIATAAAAETIINGLNEGIYVYRLTVTDNDGAKASDEVQVTVNAAVPPVNQPPKASAGNNQGITQPVNTVTLKGSGEDPDGTIVSFAWTRLSGPVSGGGTIATSTSAETAINGLNEGIYTYRLTVTDNDGAKASDEVQVTVHAAVPPVNQPPKASAGNNQGITLPVNKVTLKGSGEDPDGTIVSFAWTRLSGPVSGGGTIATSASAETTINGMKEGIYVYRLTVTDNDGAKASDDVQVKVNAAVAPPVNQAPKANAGPNQTIMLPLNTVTLKGSGEDADGTIVSYVWTKVSGPVSGGGTILTATAAETKINSLNEGTYKFRLTITDNKGEKGTDEVQIKVNPVQNNSNQPPVADAGADKIITLPVTQVTLNGERSTDPDGTLSSWEWVRISGPVAGVLSGGNTSRLKLSELVEGVYKFELTVTDNNGASASDLVTITVNPAGTTNQLPQIITEDSLFITLPVQNAELDASGSQDPDGSIQSSEWKYIKGPVGSQVLSPASLKTIVAGLVQGTYQFRLTVTDNSGGVSEKQVYVIVRKSSARRLIPTAGFFPNPAEEKITLTLDAEIDGRTQVTFYDIAGRPVYSTSIIKNTRVVTHKFSIAHLSKGIYVVEIIIERAEKVVRKIIKQ